LLLGKSTGPGRISRNLIVNPIASTQLEEVLGIFAGAGLFIELEIIVIGLDVVAVISGQLYQCFPMHPKKNPLQIVKSVP
jgi:hypothetical protein